MLPGTGTADGQTNQTGPNELDLLFRISELVSSVHTSRERFLRVMEILGEAFGINYGTLTLLGPSRKETLLEVVFGDPAEQKGSIQGLNPAIIEEVLTCARPMAFSRVTEEILPLPLSRLDEKESTLLCVPILNRKRGVGVMTTYPIYKGTVSYDKDVRLLTVIARMLFRDSPLPEDIQLDTEKSKAGPSLDEILDGKLRQMIEKVDPRTESRCALLLDIVSLVEKIVIKWALKRHQNVQTATALFLGINRNTLRKKMRDLNIHFPKTST